MISYLEKAEKKWFLSLVEKEFSPITKITASQCLEYIELMREKNLDKNKLFLTQFPRKGNYSLWLAIICGLNSFYRDQIYEESYSLDLKPNQKISLFGSVCQYLRQSHESPGCIRVKFIDNELNIDYARNKKYILFVDAERKLNKKKLYDKNRKAFFANRTPLSKILYLNSDEIIDDSKLHTRILLVAGRGNVNHLRKKLSEVEVFNEKLSKIIDLDNKFKIKPDLEEYKNYYSQEVENQRNIFFTIINRLKTETTDLDLLERLENLCKSSRFDETFEKVFNEIIDDYGLAVPALNELYKIYKKIQPAAKLDFDIVFINDLLLYDRYQNLIQGLLKNGIPIILVYERCLAKMRDIQFQNQVLSNLQDSYSFIWSNKKVNSLELFLKRAFLDDDDWLDTISFFRKKINIKCTKANRLDQLSSTVLSIIKSIDNHDCKRICSQFLYPIVFYVRSSDRISKFISSKIDEFRIKFQSMKPMVSDDIYSKIKNYLDELEIQKSNIKKINEPNHLYYSFRSNWDSQAYYTPNIASASKKLNNNDEIIVFTGFPENEFREFPIIKSIFQYRYSSIEFVCWPYEGRQTYDYIKNRLLNGLVFEKPPHNISLKEDLLLNNKLCIEEELSERLNINEDLEFKTTNQPSIEFDISLFSSLNYSEHVILESQFELDPKECNIIHLSDNKFYFHPKDGNSLLLGVEGNNGKYLIKRIDSEEIAPGYLFFDIDYSVRLKELLLLTGVKENEANESIKVLRKWKDAIVSFYDMNGKDLEETIKKLQIVKEKNTDLIDSNPSKNNLHYWLDDSEKIALSLPNLKLIARAVENTNIDFTIEDAENTYKLRNKVKGKLNTINANVKNYLQLRLNNTENGDIKNIYNYELNGLKIDVHVYSIVDVTKDNGFFVEYSKTRKILC